MRMRVLAIRTGEEWRTFAGVLCESFCHRSFCGPISAGLAITVQYNMMRCLFLLLSVLVQVHRSVSSIGQTLINLHS